MSTDDSTTTADDDRRTQLGRRAGTAADRHDGEQTQLGQRGRPGEAASPSGTSDTQLGRRGEQNGQETGLGRRVRGEQDPGPVPDDEGVVRFGPGVPRTPAASPTWSATRERQGAARRRRRPRWIGALITVALVAGVLAYLLTRTGDPLQAHAQSVTAAVGPGQCDTVVDVVGTIATNGRAGSVTYEWVRNDGQPTSVLSQTVPDGTDSTQVHLQWSFSGRGRFDARATLRVLDPAPVSEAVGTFTYSCG
jgi:hypothetical protein